MPITVTCPRCTAILTVADAGAGRSGSCPHCQGPIQVPPRGPELNQQTEVLPLPKPPAWQQLRWLLGGGVVLAVLAVGFLLLKKDDTPTTQTQLVQPISTPSANWQVIFRSDDPSLWNQDIPGRRNFAIPLDRVAASIRYLRLRNLTNQEAVIIAMTKERLNRSSADGRFGWDGSADVSWTARHLGIYYLLWPVGFNEIGIGGAARPPRDDEDQGEYYQGWGFGHRKFDEGQKYSWEGKPIPPTAFEVAVTDGTLSAEESKQFLQVETGRQ